MHETRTKGNNELDRTIWALGLWIRRGDENQLEVYVISQLLLKPCVALGCLSVLDGSGLRFCELESSLNSSLRSGMVFGESLSYRPDRNTQMRELCIISYPARSVPFEFLGGLPGPGIAIGRRVAIYLNGVIQTYKGDGVAGD